MKTILVTNNYKGIALSIVRRQCPSGFSLDFLNEQSQSCLERQIPHADYILAGGRLGITGQALEKAKCLKMVQRTGVGLDSIDLEALRKLKIPLYVNKGVNAESVAEHALLLILASLRRLSIIAGNTRKGLWSRHEQALRTYELKGKTVGMIGMGSIARTLAALLRPFGVKILYSDVVRADISLEKELCMEFSDICKVLSDSDIITLHCPLTLETKGLINKETICNMKDGAILVNTARGGLINTKDLSDALTNGKLSFAALDVHEEEPFPESYPLKKLDNVILTPHIAGITADSFGSMMMDAFRNISLFDQGRLEDIEQFRHV